MLLIFPVTGNAACLGESGLTHYEGTISTGDRVRMTLELGRQDVNGTYFHFGELREISLRGKLDGSNIVLDELDGSGGAIPRLSGRFPEQDPERKLSGPLMCDMIVGDWIDGDSAQKRPVVFRLDDIIGGDLHHRYVGAGSLDDALVERNARRFWEAVKRGDKRTASLMIDYPINVRINGARVSVKSRRRMIELYDRIFSKRYRAAIAHDVPIDMFANDHGIMLGDGEVWFRDDGRVEALNNF
jgi:hypothetical protein